MIREDDFRITTGDLDGYDVIRPYAIFDYFQIMAGIHGEEVGVGFEAMNARNCHWVITKNKYRILKYPNASDKIIVRTWPIEPGRADFDRAYQILDCNNEVLIEGKNKWCAIDADTKRIVRSSNIQLNGEYVTDITSDIEFERTPNIKKEDMNYQFSYQVRMSGLDHYHHLNNAKYGEIFLDALDLSNKRIKEMQINNMNEAKLGVKIYIYTLETDNRVDILGLLEDDKICFTGYCLLH